MAEAEVFLLGILSLVVVVIFAILFIVLIVLVVTGRQILDRLCRAVEVEEHLSVQIHSLGKILKSMAEQEKTSEGPLSGAIRL